MYFDKIKLWINKSAITTVRVDSEFMGEKEEKPCFVFKVLIGVGDKEYSVFTSNNYDCAIIAYYELLKDLGYEYMDYKMKGKFNALIAKWSDQNENGNE